MNEHGRFGFKMWDLPNPITLQAEFKREQSGLNPSDVDTLRYRQTWWEMPWSKMGKSSTKMVDFPLSLMNYRRVVHPNSPSGYFHQKLEKSTIYRNLPMFGCQQNNHNLSRPRLAQIIPKLVDIHNRSAHHILQYQSGLTPPISPSPLAMARRFRSPPWDPWSAGTAPRTDQSRSSKRRKALSQGMINLISDSSLSWPTLVGGCGCGCGWVGRWKASFLGISGGVGQIPYWDNYSMCHCQ